MKQDEKNAKVKANAKVDIATKVRREEGRVKGRRERIEEKKRRADEDEEKSDE